MNDTPYIFQNITNITHLNDTYIINLMEKFPYLTAIQSFVTTLCNIMGDDTFVLFILLKLKFPKSTLLFFAILTSLLTLNTLNIFIGKSMDLLLYQFLIDLIAIIVYSSICIINFMKFFDKRNTLTYVECIQKSEKKTLKSKYTIDMTNSNKELTELLLDKEKEQKMTFNSIEEEQDYLYHKYYEGHSKAFLFWIFAKAIFIAIFGDCYMFAIIANASIANIPGVFIGSSLAIIVVVYLGCYHGIQIGSYLTEAKMGGVVSFIYFSLACEIFYLNDYLNIGIFE